MTVLLIRGFSADQRNFEACRIDKQDSVKLPSAIRNWLRPLTHAVSTLATAHNERLHKADLKAAHQLVAERLPWEILGKPEGQIGLAEVRRLVFLEDREDLEARTPRHLKPLAIPLNKTPGRGRPVILEVPFSNTRGGKREDIIEHQPLARLSRQEQLQVVSAEVKALLKARKLPFQVDNIEVEIYRSDGQEGLRALANINPGLDSLHLKDEFEN